MIKENFCLVETLANLLLQKNCTLYTSFVEKVSKLLSKLTVRSLKKQLYVLYQIQNLEFVSMTNFKFLYLFILPCCLLELPVWFVQSFN